jgi:hypothetical protein
MENENKKDELNNELLIEGDQEAHKKSHESSINDNSLNLEEQESVDLNAIDLPDDSYVLCKNNSFKGKEKKRLEIRSLSENFNTNNYVQERENVINIRRTKSIQTIDSDYYFVPGQNERKFFDRYFGKLEDGSIRGSIFTIATMTMGIGVLNIPWLFSKTGLIQGIIIMIISCIIDYWILLNMNKVAKKYKSFNYSTLVDRLFGKKFSLALDILIWINYVLGLIFYQVISKNF